VQPEQNHSPIGIAFIPSALDDAGLTPNEFRIYCAILRRGDCFESVPKIAIRCQMHRDTAWACIKKLEARGAIIRTARLGTTTLLTATSLNVWAPSGNGGSAENKGYPSKPGDTQPLNAATTQPEIRAIHPAETEGYKGNPIEGSPIKDTERDTIPASERPDRVALHLSEIVAYGADYGIPEETCRQWLEHIKAHKTAQWKRGLRGAYSRAQQGRSSVFNSKS
jgi:hypothetical protein